jgi:hypothetical protein
METRKEYPSGYANRKLSLGLSHHRALENRSVVIYKKFLHTHQEQSLTSTVDIHSGFEMTGVVVALNYCATAAAERVRAPRTKSRVWRRL